MRKLMTKRVRICVGERKAWEFDKTLGLSADFWRAAIPQPPFGGSSLCTRRDLARSAKSSWQVCAFAQTCDAGGCAFARGVNPLVGDGETCAFAQVSGEFACMRKLMTERVRI